MTQDEQTLLAQIVVENEVYESVLDQMELPDDEVYRDTIKDILQKKTMQFVVIKIWENMSDEQSEEFLGQLERALRNEPYLEYDDVLIRYALEHREIAQKIADDLEKFFKRFIATHKKIKNTK